MNLFWQNKKVLVTGAGGFIGSHLVERLAAEGAQVRAFVRYNSRADVGLLKLASPEIRSQLEIIGGDLRDEHAMRKAVEGCQVVLHLGALISIPYSYYHPVEVAQTNVIGTLNVLNACREAGVERLVHTSTSEVYGTALYVPIDEKHPLQPQSPYSASKIGADAIAMSYYHSFHLPVTIARPFNTYGPRQSARAIIPTIIGQIASGKKKIHIGDTRPTRDFNYVTDTCRGMVALAKCDKATGEVVNIGSNTEISIHDLFETIKKLMRADEVACIEDPQRIRPARSEVFRLRCNNEKIKTLTGFEPQYSLEKGLQETIQWFSQPANLNRYKNEIYNV